jgi:gliding motility-associated-like protein
VVHEAPTPAPVIEGVLFNCGGNPAVLTTDSTYSSYSWSNGSHSPSISVGTGTYSVTVTNDEGCAGTSASVNVNSANSPIASFIGNPNGTVFPGATVTYTDQSNPNGATVASITWTLDSAGVILASGSGSTFTHQFMMPGSYHITVTVTTTDGCTGTYTYEQIVVPVQIIIPNVFSPNNDGENDALAFEGAQYYPNTSLSVFNRWGQEVYSSSNYKNTWKPGKDIAEGTYFFVLKLIDGKEYTGNVTLLR